MKKQTEQDQVRAAVRERYGKIAETEGAYGVKINADPAKPCCSPGGNKAAASPEALGYAPADLDGIPEGSEMGLGCGNPVAIGSIGAGETVVDLGSGGGFDCFIAARKTGLGGRIIGIDMTPSMISKARGYADSDGFSNVEFRLGEIENLPVADNEADLVLSNCVINLSPDKPRVFRETFRILKPGGRLAIADIVATGVMPEEVRKDVAHYTGCLAGAMLVDDLQRTLAETGFTEIDIDVREETREMLNTWTETGRAGEFAASAFITARKPCCCC